MGMFGVHYSTADDSPFSGTEVFLTHAVYGLHGSVFFMLYSMKICGARTFHFYETLISYPDIKTAYSLQKPERPNKISGPAVANAVTIQRLAFSCASCFVMDQQVTAFVALLTMDANRQKAGRMDWLCCCRSQMFLERVRRHYCCE